MINLRLINPTNKYLFPFVIGIPEWVIKLECINKSPCIFLVINPSSNSVPPPSKSLGLVNKILKLIKEPSLWGSKKFCLSCSYLTINKSWISNIISVYI